MSSLNYLNNAQSRYDNSAERQRKNQAIGRNLTSNLDRRVAEEGSRVPRDEERGNCLSKYSFSVSSTSSFVKFHSDFCVKCPEFMPPGILMPDVYKTSKIETRDA